jgi:hypothetical protein
MRNMAARGMRESGTMTNDKGETFGEWLLAQRDREGWVGDLVRAARADPKFPKRGDPEAVRARLCEMQAKGEMFEAVDDAELDWRSY